MRAAAVCLALIVTGCGAEAPSRGAAPPRPAFQVPEGSLRGDAAAGGVLYGRYCATCHGHDGRGSGPMSASLDPKPADHADAAYMASLSDEHLYTVILKGGGFVGKSTQMTGFLGVVNEDETRDLIAFMRELSGT